MATFLFDKIIFGPISSRRLGQSLGINLLPTNKKVCNFDCIYCECGLTEGTTGNLPSRSEVKSQLEKVLTEFKEKGGNIDTITFAGNGEPTLHREFEEIISDTFNLRNKYFPKAKIALLTNSTTLGSPKVQRSMKKIDQNIFKVDSVLEPTVKLLNSPIGEFDIKKITALLKKIPSPIIQTMFIRGAFKGIPVDNTTEEELVPWLNALEEIKPPLVMIYTIARDTPFETLQKVPLPDLEKIASRIRKLGIEVQISG